MEADPSAPVWNHTPASAMARPVGHCLEGSLRTWAPSSGGQSHCPRPKYVCVTKGQAHRCRDARCYGVLFLNLAMEPPREPALLFRVRGRSGFPEDSP